MYCEHEAIAAAIKELYILHTLLHRDVVIYKSKKETYAIIKKNSQMYLLFPAIWMAYTKIFIGHLNQNNKIYYVGLLFVLKNGSFIDLIRDYFLFHLERAQKHTQNTGTQIQIV